MDRIVSKGQPAFQSTTLFGYEGSKAVDGVLGSADNCTSTGFVNSTKGKPTTSPWWAVDLEAEWNVTRILVTNRGDSFADRLSNFEIRVGTTAPFGNGTRDPIDEANLCNTGLSVPKGETKEFNCTASGRYVVIRIPGKNKVLSLCEVQVYARGMCLHTPECVSIVSVKFLWSFH